MTSKEITVPRGALVAFGVAAVCAAAVATSSETAAAPKRNQEIQYYTITSALDLKGKQRKQGIGLPFPAVQKIRESGRSNTQTKGGGQRAVPEGRVKFFVDSPSLRGSRSITVGGSRTEN